MITCQGTATYPLLLAVFSSNAAFASGGSEVKQPEDTAGGSTLHSTAPWLSCTFCFPQHHKDLASVEASDTAVSGLASRMLPSVLKNTVKAT